MLKVKARGVGEQTPVGAVDELLARHLETDTALRDELPQGSGKKPKYLSLRQGLLGIVVFLGLWQLVSSLHLLNPTFISSPYDVAQSGYGLLSTALFWNDVRISAIEFGVGYGLAGVVGISIGFLLGLFQRVDNHTQPLLSALYATPHVAFFPIMIVWFGIGVKSKEALVFLLAVLPIIIAVRSGAKILSTQYIELAKIYQGTRPRVLFKVIVPGCLPSVLNGLRLAVGTGLVAVFVGELYAANAGLGYLAANAGETLNTSVALFSLTVFAITGLSLSGVITLVERRFAHWE